MRSGTEPVRLVIEIDRAEPLRGTVAEAGEPLCAFDGWTAFAAAVAGAVRRIDPRVGPPEGPSSTVGG
ncbi:MAG: hypothetical protein QOH12_2179 [Solirubrobacteraceae bacterium]|jgi:hypothetical protein|nr:hypothetical protein [Solirubrobacteraceae bacterium]